MVMTNTMTNEASGAGRNPRRSPGGPVTGTIVPQENIRYLEGGQSCRKEIRPEGRERSFCGESQQLA